MKERFYEAKIMRDYRFYVDLCGGSTGGFITIKADDDDEAYDKAFEYVGKKLSEAFPDLEIGYNVELFDKDYDVERR